LRQIALDVTFAFTEKYLQSREFIPGESVVPVSGKVLNSDGLCVLVDPILDGWSTAGQFTAEFERNLAKYASVRSALFVNSHSSANLVDIKHQRNSR